MKTVLKSAWAIIMIFVLSMALFGCISENSKNTIISEETNTAFETSGKYFLMSKTEKNSVTESKKEDTHFRTEKSSALPSEKISSLTEFAKETNPDNTAHSEKISQETEKAFAPSSFKGCAMATSELRAFRYWLYTPPNPTSNMPLIVYLHGGSGKGDDLNRIVSVDGFPKYLQAGEFGDLRAYVIIPQLPASKKGWENAAESLYELIQATVTAYDIDKNNISLTGHSMGGTGTYNIACYYPSLFARIAPLSGSVRNTPDIIEKLKNIPIKAFVGSSDTIVPPESSEELIAELKRNGGNAQITVFEGADHFSVPALTYLDKEINLINWLIGN